jgi:hypothetical protein
MVDWVILVVLLIILVVYIMQRQSELDVYRFHKPSCPSCVASQSEWDMCKAQALLRPINFIDVDISIKNNRALADQMGVRKVPHVVAVNDLGESYVYSGKRLAVDYLNWIMSLPR